MNQRFPIGWILLAAFVVALGGGAVFLLLDLLGKAPLERERRPAVAAPDEPGRSASLDDAPGPRRGDVPADPAEPAEPAPETAAPDAFAFVRGTVLGERGPIAGAEVRLYSIDGVYDLVDRLEDQLMIESVDDIPELVDKIEGEILAFAATAETERTAKDGTYAFEDLEPGAYFALTLAPGHVFGFGDGVDVSEGVTRVLDVELDRGAPIEGTVVDANGNAVSGARLLAVYHPPGMASFTKIARRFLGYLNGEVLRGPLVTTSDANGRFAFDVLPPGTYDLVVERAGAAPVEAESVRTGDRGVLVTLLPGAEVTGRLVSTDGSPVAGIAMRLEPSSEADGLPFPGMGDAMVLLGGLLDDTTTFETTTADDGRFVFPAVSPGAYDLRADPRGYVPIERSVALDSGEVDKLGDLTIDPGEALYGRVVDEAGVPVAGVRVTANAARDGFDMFGGVSDMLSGRLQTRTDASGRFTIAGLSKGKYDLSARASGYGQAFQEDVVPGTGTTLTLGPGWTVRGQVVRGVGGGAIEGVRVSAGGVSTETDSAGRFVLEGVSPGERAPGGLDFDPSGREPRWVRVTAKHSDFVPARERVQAENIDGCVLELWPPTRFEGRVVGPSGEPLAGCFVQLVPPSDTPGFLAENLFVGATMTDLEGRFSVTGGAIDLGNDYRLKATHPKYATGFSEDISVVKGETPPPVEIALSIGGVVEGRVTDGARPLSNVRVRLGPKSENDREERMMLTMFGIPAAGRRTHTDDEGTFRFEQVAPGSYEVEAKGVHFADSSTEEISIVEGGYESVELQLDPGGTVAGLVVGPGGVPLPGARVLIQEQGGDAEMRMMRRMMSTSIRTEITDEYGMFEAVGIPREPVTVLATLDGFVPTEVPDVLPDSGSLEIALLPEASIEGRVVDADTGAAIHEFQVRLERQGVDRTPAEERMPFDRSDRWRTFEDSSGRFAFQGLEPGNYALEVKARGYAMHGQDVFLREGRRENVRVGLVLSGLLTGTVKDDGSGRPIRGARVSFRSGNDDSEEGSLQAMFRGDVRTDEEGRFEIGEIPLDDPVLVVRHQSYVTERREVRVAPGQVRDIEVRLGRGFSISGFAFLPSGAPASGQFLTLTGADGTFKFGGISDDGAFRFPGLAPGRYTIRQMSRGPGSQTVVTELDVAGETSDLRLELTPAEMSGGG